MDAELKSKWVNALRGGDYQQTRNTLRDKSGFCCLGVLCDISGLSADEKGRLNPYDAIGDHVPRWSKLAAMNDDGKSFPEIADWIEANI